MANRAYAYRGQDLSVPGAGNSNTVVTLTIYYVVITPTGAILPGNGNAPTGLSGVQVPLGHGGNLKAAIRTAVRTDQSDSTLRVTVL